ncbi:MAG TPA: glycosyltransferase [Flavobacteriaceae bacterium]|nr:glycosyltransferase [Flavobacteriaceae bacterium]
MTNNLASGGAEKVLVNLVNHIDKTKYNITLRTLMDVGENRQYLSDTVTYKSIFKKSFKGINYLHYLPKRYIYNKVAYGQFDVIVVYLHGVLTKIVANAPSKQKTIAYLHANMQNSPFIKSFKSTEKLQSCFKTYNAIVSVSKSVEDSFKAVSGIEENLHVIYNTFDVAHIKAKATEKLDLEYEQHGKLKLCAVGSLNKIKGFDRLINALGRIKKEGKSDFILNIIGKGPEKNYLQQLIKEHNLQKNIFLIGFKSNPYKYIAKSDLFVSSSLSEGFSSVVAESVILGVPVFTTDTPGMKEILGENNEYGIIVENNEKALYTGLKKLIQDRSLLKEYKQRVKMRSSFFSTQKAVKEVEDLLNQVMESK